MTDAVDQNQNTPAENAPVEVSQTEREARAAGWVPKEEFQGDENKWVDADEFVRRGPLFEKINMTTRELKEVRKALEQLKGHHAQVKETAFKEALEALKKQKRDAYVEGDPDKIVELDEKIDNIKDAQRQFAQEQAREVQQTTTELNPQFKSWLDRNSWYNNSVTMRAAADALGLQLSQKGMSPTEVLKQVEIQIRDEFPSKFRNPNRDSAQSVETGRANGRKAKDTFELTSEERSIMNRFVRAGAMTEEQYINDLKQIKGMK